jgi:fructose-1,6-bisphosphatase/inositol monophosphatase family enzyme
MAFDPQLSTRQQIRDYFRTREDRFTSLVPLIEAFLEKPTLESGKAMLRAYFRAHLPGDIASLRTITACFADKRSVRSIVQSILDDEQAMAGIARRSYPHPIGFDKLVLDDDRQTGFKFRLHVYWRGANFASLERMHLHRFEMASAIVTGELTNHIWRVIGFEPANRLLAGIDLAAPVEEAVATRKEMPAYAGYLREANGQLRKSFLGKAIVERGPSETFTSGDAYAQVLEDAHFVETNAETGFANGDFCSTVYIHGPSLLDKAGRALPILFEEELLADDNQLIREIPNLTVPALHDQLCRYRDTLDEILNFYEWVYDPKHGRNLSTGMIAGYLLCEAFKTPHVIDLFEKRYDECKEILLRHEGRVREVIQTDCDLSRLSQDDRNSRYVCLLVAKAKAHAGGPSKWLEDFGSLTREMWRYFGAIRGEINPKITVLKPIWDRVVKKKLPGGMHYGHIGAMIEAAFEANQIALKHFETHLQATHKDDRNVCSLVDSEIEDRIKQVLNSHYPGYRFYGEEAGDTLAALPEIGQRRFLIDPIDGTRNFLNHRQEFAISIACQEWNGQRWHSTDGVVCHPPTGRIFWAEQGQGAFLIDRHDRETRCLLRPLTLDEVRPLRHQVIDYSARGFGIERETEVYRSLLQAGAVLRNTGSVALLLAQMAGRGGTGCIVTAKDHDVEAGLTIAREAGCTWSQFDFEIDGETRTVTLVGTDSRIHGVLQEIAGGAL